MDQLTIVCMLLASLLHASWHALVKSSDDQLAVLCGMCLVSAAMAAAALPFVAPPPAAVWPVLAVSVALHSGYRASHAAAPQQSDDAVPAGQHHSRRESARRHRA